MASTKKNTMQGTITKSEMKKALKTAPNEVYADKIGATSYHAPDDLKESAVIMIANSSGFPEQFTIHKPIGITDCTNEDWVMTRTCDVNTLIARKKDPRQVEIAQQQARNRTELLITKGFLVKVGDNVYYEGFEEHTRNEYLDAAEKKLQIAKKESKATSKQTRTAFLDPPQMAAETAISDFLKKPEAIKMVEKNAKQTFRTMGGVLEDQPQQPIAALKGKSLREVQATLTKMVFKTIGLGEGIEVIVSTSKPPEEQGTGDQGSDDEDDDMGNPMADAYKDKCYHAATTCSTAHKALETLKTLVQTLKPGMSKDMASKIGTAMMEIIEGIDMQLAAESVALTASPGE